MAFIPIAEMRQRFGFTQRGGVGGGQAGGATLGSVFPSGTGGFAGLFDSLFSGGLLPPSGRVGQFQPAPDLLSPLRSRAAEGPIGIGEFLTSLIDIMGRNQPGSFPGAGSSSPDPGLPPQGSPAPFGIGAPLRFGPDSRFVGDSPQAISLRQQFFGPNASGRLTA